MIDILNYSGDQVESGNLILGGTTADSGVYQASLIGRRPIILSMNPDGSYLWAKSITAEDYQGVTAVAASKQSSNNYLAAVLQQSLNDVCFIQIHRTTGSIDWVTKLDMPNFNKQLFSQTLLIDNNQNIFAVFTLYMYSDNNVGIIKFQGQQNNPPVLSFKLSQEESTAHAVIADNGYDYLYIGGFSETYQYSHEFYASITQVDNDLNILSSQGFIQGASTNFYEISKLDMMYDASLQNYCQFACIANGLNIILAKFIVDQISHTQEVSYSVLINSYSQCLAVATKSGDCHSNYYLASIDQTVRVGVLQSTSGITDTYFHQVYSDSNSAFNTIKDGFFYQEKAYYLGGWLNITFSSNPYIFTQAVAFLMTTEPDESDMYINQTIVGPTAKSNSTLLIWNQFPFIYILQGYPLIDVVYIQGIINTTIISQLPQVTIYTIIPSNINNQTYFLGDLTTDYYFAEFTVAEDCTDISFTYSGTFSYNPDDIFMFNATSKYFTINTLPTSSTQYIGIYTLTIEALMNNGQTANKSFNLEIKSNCYSAAIVPSLQSNILHEIEQPGNLVYSFNAFTSNPTGCAFLYTLSQINGTSLTTIVNFDTAALTVTISPTASSFLGTYQYSLTGSLVDNFILQTSVELFIKILPVCGAAIITPIDSSTYSYYLDSGVSLHLFTPNWPISNSSCGTVSYQIVNATDNSPANTGIITLSAINEVIVNTQDFDNQGTHNLSIIASSSNSNVTQVFDIFEVIIGNQCYAAAISVPFTIPAQTYTFGQGESRVPYGTMLIDKSVCGGITYILLVDNFFSISDLTLDTINKEIVIDTTNITLQGVRNCQLIGTSLQGGVQESANFTVTIIDPCLTVTLKTSPTATFIESASLNLYQLVSLPVVYFDDVINYICDIEYIVTDLGLLSLPAAVSYESANHRISVNDTLSQAAYQQTLNVQGFINGRPTKFLNYTFVVDFQQDCSLNQIDIIDNSTLVPYELYSSSQFYDYSSLFQIHFPSCPIAGVITDSFDCKFQNGSTCDSNTLFTSDPNYSFLTFDSQDKTKIGTHVAVIQINQQGLTGYLKLELVISCDCRCTNIALSVIPNGSYDISNGTQTYTHHNLAWVSSDPISCPINYALYTQSLGSPHSMFSINSTTKDFNVSVNQSSTVGTYPLRVVSKVGSLIETEVFYDFQITITNICSTTTNISPTAMIEQNYTITQSTMNFTFLPWTATPSYCTNFNYSALIDTDSSSLPSFIVFDPLNRMFSVQTNSVSDRGNYQIRVSGYLDVANTFSSVISLNAKVPCNLNTITSPVFNISSAITYIIGEPQMDLIFTPFVELSNGECGDITYELAFNGIYNTSYYDIVYLTSSDRKISIFTSDIVTFNNTLLSITVKGQLGAFLSTQNFNLLLIYSCQIYNLTASTLDVALGSINTSSSYQYYIGSGEMNIDFNPFTQYEACNEVITYTLELEDSNSLPDFITLFDSIRRIIVSTNDTKDGLQSVYTLKVIAQVSTLMGIVQGYLLIPLRMRVINNLPPQFVSPLSDLTLQQGTSIKYTFPDIIDRDGDEIDQVQIDFGQAATFITGSYPELLISPNLQTLGTFILSISVSDLSLEPKSATYNLKVTVTQYDYNQTDQSQNNSSGSQQMIVTDPKRISTDLTATIKSITIEGVVTIQFNKQMNIPSDYSTFNQYTGASRLLKQKKVDIGSQILLLKLKSRDGEYLNNVIFTWSVISFQKSLLKLQLDFKDSREISFKVNQIHFQSIQDLDELEITFQANSKFIQQSDGLVIKQGLNIKKTIPKQLRDDGNYIFSIQNHLLALTQILKDSGESTIDALEVFAYGSIALNFAMYLF
eukprot:403345047